MFEVDGILYASSPKDLLKIIDAKVTGKMMMLLTFSSGEQRVFDAENLQGEVFAPLKDEAIFKNVTIVRGVVTWMNEEIDCSPEYMYEKSYPYNTMGLAI